VTLLKKAGFSPQRRKDHKDFLWTFSVLGVLSVLAVPFFSGLIREIRGKNLFSSGWSRSGYFGLIFADI
jgi:hypothetical protein